MNSPSPRRVASRASSFLARVFFRTLGTMCLVAAGGAAWVGWYAWSHWDPNSSPVGLGLAGAAMLATGRAAAHCFSPRRTLIEALDAMEGVPGDPPRRSSER